MDANTTGHYNTACGYAALTDQTQNNGNSGFGYEAGEKITTGDYNTLLGYKAGYNLTQGTNSIAIGKEAQFPSAGANNNIILGNSSIQHLRCQVSSIESLSDERDKTDIVDLTEGLDLVNTLKPRKFTWAMREESANNGKTEIGFIAQELDTAFGDSNDYVKIVDKQDPEKLAVAQGKLIPILVKALQELSAKVAALEAA